MQSLAGRRRGATALAAALLLAMVACFPQTGFPETGGWKVGIAEAVITPEKPLWLSGYSARNRPAEGKIHDLRVKALTLDDGEGHRAVFVASDLLGFPKVLSDGIFQRLKERLELDREQILLSSTHTHSGPVLATALVPCYPLSAAQWEEIGAYSKWLEQRVVETVVRAFAKPVPALLFAGSGKATFAVNRRNNREPDVPRLRREGKPLAGPVDHSVPVLAVRSPDGELLAAVFGYACHNTNLDGYLWCGDYAGFAQLEVEKLHPKAVAMFWSGCGADQNPLPRRSLELCESYGKRLATAVDRVLERPMSSLEPSLETAFRLVSLDFERSFSREELQEMSSSTSALHRRWAELHLAELDAGQAFPTSYPYPILAWRLGGRQLWIALGGEVVVDYPLRLKRELGETTWVTGYANDVMGYIPSRRIQKEGGYEAAAFHVYGQPAPGWAPDVEERVISTVRELVGQLDSGKPTGP